MTTTEVIQFVLILMFLGASYWWLWTLSDRELRKVLVKNDSAEYPVTQSGSMFVPSFDPYVLKGSEIYIPVTDGLYHTRVKANRRIQYMNGLKTWVERGADVHLVVTRADERCCGEWQQLVDEHPDGFHVHILDRSKAAQAASDSIELQIAALDTFHPALLVNLATNTATRSAAPGAMWIELNHPVGSKYAYDVSFVNPERAQETSVLRSIGRCMKNCSKVRT